MKCYQTVEDDFPTVPALKIILISLTFNSNSSRCQ